MTIMTLPSRTSPSVRCEDWGRDRTYHQPLVTYTLAERVENAKTENDMIASMAGGYPQRAAGSDEPRAKTPHGCAESLIIAALDEPRTGAEIAEATGLAMSTIWKRLGKLEERGKIFATDQGNRADGGPMPRLWQKAAAPNVIANIQRGKETDARVLSMMDSPVAPFQIMAKAGLSRAAISASFRRLAKDGLIKQAPEPVRNSRGLPVTTWVRA